MGLEKRMKVYRVEKEKKEFVGLVKFWLNGDGAVKEIYFF